MQAHQSNQDHLNSSASIVSSQLGSNTAKKHLWKPAASFILKAIVRLPGRQRSIYGSWPSKTKTSLQKQTGPQQHHCASELYWSDAHDNFVANARKRVWAVAEIWPHHTWLVLVLTHEHPNMWWFISPEKYLRALGPKLLHVDNYDIINTVPYILPFPSTCQIHPDPFQSFREKHQGTGARFLELGSTTPVFGMGI